MPTKTGYMHVPTKTGCMHVVHIYEIKKQTVKLFFVFTHFLFILKKWVTQSILLSIYSREILLIYAVLLILMPGRSCLLV